MKPRDFLASLLVFLATGSALRAQSITMQTVTIGNSGNSADPATGSLYGSVGYTYNIGEYDVTDSQYCTFLNAVDPTGANALGLYSPRGDAKYGVTFNSGAASGSKYSVVAGFANMPVVEVDYWDTLRFVNWMNNGQGKGSTETGAYTLTGGNTDGYGTPSNAPALLTTPQHNAAAVAWLPSENEWYKAAYYNPANGTYSTYATQSNTAPGNVIGSGSNQANYYTGNGYAVTQGSNYSSSQNYLTATGTFSGSASYYGTYDQSGNVDNWVAATVNSLYPVLRGGSWADTPGPLSSSYRASYFSPTFEYGYFGFRVAGSPLPWIATAAAASPSTVLLGATTSLTTLAADLSGESILTYSWQATGTPPGTVTFTANATNAASQTGASFSHPGNYSLLVTASDPQGHTATSSVSVTVDATYSSWVGQYLSNPASSAATATPEYDGIPNLLKYLFDINPSRGMAATDWAAVPTVSGTTISGSYYLTLTYRQNPFTSGLTVNVQTCADLETWETVVPNFTETIGTDPATGDPLIQVGVNTDGATDKFIRLDVTSP